MGDKATRRELEQQLEAAQLKLELAHLKLMLYTAFRNKANLNDPLVHARIKELVDEMIDNWDEADAYSPPMADMETQKLLTEYDECGRQIVCLQAELEDEIEEGQTNTRLEELDGKTRDEIAELVNNRTDKNITTKELMPEQGLIEPGGHERK